MNPPAKLELRASFTPGDRHPCARSGPCGSPRPSGPSPEPGAWQQVAGGTSTGNQLLGVGAGSGLRVHTVVSEAAEGAPPTASGAPAGSCHVCSQAITPEAARGCGEDTAASRVTSRKGDYTAAPEKLPSEDRGLREGRRSRLEQLCPPGTPAGGGSVPRSSGGGTACGHPGATRPGPLLVTPLGIRRGVSCGRGRDLLPIPSLYFVSETALS